MQRSAKARGSIHGRALPPISISSFTTCRPGSGKTEWPRAAISARSADLPPPEQPETTTSRWLPLQRGLPAT